MLITPEVVTHAAKARLHLIGDAEAPRRADAVEDPGDIARHRLQHAIGEKGAVDDDGGGFHARLGQREDRPVGIHRIAGAGVRGAMAQRAAIEVGGGNRADMVGSLGGAQGAGGQRVIRLGDAVIGEILGQRAPVPSPFPRHAPGDVIGLGA